jgi:hypothetical protein
VAAGTQFSLAQYASETGVSKSDMPDLMASANACLPTATANLLYWFGKHGFPAILPRREFDDEEQQATLKNIIMGVAGGNFENGTSAIPFAEKLQSFIESKGYHAQCSVVNFTHMSADMSWSLLRTNSRPDVGYLLMIIGGQYLYNGDQFQLDPRMGHAITLVDIGQKTLIIDDPAHAAFDSGRQTLQSLALTRANSYNSDTGQILPCDGCYLLTGQCLTGHDLLMFGAIQVVISKDPIARAQDPFQQVGLVYKP